MILLDIRTHNFDKQDLWWWWGLIETDRTNVSRIKNSKDVREIFKIYIDFRQWKQITLYRSFANETN